MALRKSIAAGVLVLLTCILTTRSSYLSLSVFMGEAPFRADCSTNHIIYATIFTQSQDKIFFLLESTLHLGIDYNMGRGEGWVHVAAVAPAPALTRGQTCSHCSCPHCPSLPLPPLPSPLPPNQAALLSAPLLATLQQWGQGDGDEGGKFKTTL